MSRIGNQIITIPDGVTIDLTTTSIVVRGSKGELNLQLHRDVVVTQAEKELTVKPKHQTKLSHSLQGTFQRLISNLITGVTTGFSKDLELIGTGYRVAKQGNIITLSLGFSHPIEYQIPTGIVIDVEGNNKIKVSGIDKQQVGQVAAEIRAYRSPEPYKGKGVRYSDEVIRRKAGKAAKAAA